MLLVSSSSFTKFPTSTSILATKVEVLKFSLTENSDLKIWFGCKVICWAGTTLGCPFGFTLTPSLKRLPTIVSGPAGLWPIVDDDISYRCTSVAENCVAIRESFAVGVIDDLDYAGNIR